MNLRTKGLEIPGIGTLTSDPAKRYVSFWIGEYTAFLRLTLDPDGEFALNLMKRGHSFGGKFVYCEHPIPGFEPPVLVYGLAFVQDEYGNDKEREDYPALNGLMSTVLEATCKAMRVCITLDWSSSSEYMEISMSRRCAVNNPLSYGLFLLLINRFARTLRAKFAAY